MYLSIRPLLLATLFAGTQGAIQVALCQETPAPPAAALSAREIFYLADEVPAAAKAKQTPPPPHKTGHPKAAATATQAAAQTSEPRDTASYPDAVQSSSAQVHLASVVNRQYPPLGMRYAVFRLADGAKQPVDADTVFHSNDHIQFTVDVNAPAYLYVISRGSSGKWSTLFPASDADQSANLIQPHAGYTFPPGQMITFTAPAGKEELFLFLSRQPVHSTEDLMLQMSNGGKTTPASRPAEQLPHGNLVEAFNRMDDSQISFLRTTYSRDLIVEKVDTDSAAAAPAPPVAQAPQRDNSVYVVNPSAGADAHVVADVTFRHE